MLDGTQVMPQEEEILAFQRQCEAFYPPDAVDAPIAQQRQWYDALCAAFAPPLPAGMEKQDGVVAGVPVRRYRPERVTTDAQLCYFHGGGFVVGSLESHDGICAEIADAVGAELTAVDYRLAPEHRYPAPADDCYAVLRLILDRGDKVIVIGDSAGGNLAAGVTIRASQQGIAGGLIGQVLIYPGLGGDLVSGSYAEMANAPGLTTADVAYYRKILSAPEDDPVAFPLKANDLSGLPPAYITSAHFDPLRDDARLYAERLEAAGVAVTYRDEPEMVHAWLRARHMSPGARAGFVALCEGIKALLT
ncbi:alpha/beta hydrolase [Rhizobium sp. NRK18]|uniref:alpha/beta hydrolase n=1 Tax=Rhizobium sp. NRK18 TaxID=2964667 RepID=UPI0021C456A2|nr:alpha/beta hydrolase [Rhizobium sp. NRK18]MCQ2002914.1 alpha/beta hydrolase [Rhizobium sp. NRK18]